MHFAQVCIILYLYVQFSPRDLSPAVLHTQRLPQVQAEGSLASMDIAVGDTILTRKKHPCGAASFEVLRVGMDFKIRCTGCGHEVMLPRAKIEKNIKKVVRPGAV